MDEPLDLNALSVVGLPLPTDATFVQRREYYYNTCRLPGRVDRWLRSNSRTPSIVFLREYLMLLSPISQHVTCTVTMECTATASGSLQLYVLYLTAHVGEFAAPHCLQRDSPRIVLERFTGNNLALNAPIWTRMKTPTAQFQQPIDTFMALYLHMSAWAENMGQGDLPSRMMRWVGSVMPVLSDRVSVQRRPPVTPTRARMIKNARALKQHQCRCKYGKDRVKGIRHIDYSSAIN
ncbi:hypothetical protein FIBSPDRAFT_891148 [Athelia psychrophila]|uniref:Uncharacterized protein n=1 Tax=Athelia psychrophila TaxID=1759441 RepID=A0A166K1X7_9AGAM|nr:hypothetical protein FIBSPDRAFT_891144 [Fibularhizoctonia sp. CBS 109695]KZP21443.1 hypothetical protein FIBSPDRAFT_891148 [Fibularhizoctonia sp. CBS 109695]